MADPLRHIRDLPGNIAITFRWGALYGAGAAVSIYSILVLFLLFEIYVMAGGLSAGIGGRSFLFGTIGDFYGSHLGATSGYGLGVEGVSAVPTVLYVLVGPVVLMYAGRRSSQRQDSRTVTSDVVQGASIMFGYFPVVVFGLALLSGLASFPAVGIRPIQVVIVAGLVYPLLFGALGGYTTRVWERDSSR